MSDAMELKFDGPSGAKTILALAHGAGAGMDSPFMHRIAEELGERGYRVARFNFPYMAEKLRTGRGKPPDREPVLRESWLQVIESLRSQSSKRRNGRLVIGGKSMGGRIASMVADEAKVDGLICLGYPFHPVGKPTQLRTKHLETLKTPTLIVQGERDSFGTKAEVKTWKLSSAVRFAWMPDGDHSFKPRKSSGVTEEENLRKAVEAMAEFLKSLPT